SVGILAAVSTWAKYCRRHGSASQMGMSGTGNQISVIRLADRHLVHAETPVSILITDIRLLIPDCVHAEKAVAPDPHRRPAAAARQRLKRLDRIFVAVFGVNGLAGAKTDRL